MKISEIRKCNYVLHQKLSHFAFLLQFVSGITCFGGVPSILASPPRNCCYIITSEAERGRRRQHNP